jgi:DnaK suppressor protein
MRAEYEGLSLRLKQELAETLLGERDRLRRGVRSLASAEQALGESQGTESDGGGDAADVASDLAEEEVTLVLEYAERGRLAEIEAALQRITAERYGQCERCGQPIEPRRLCARPWARTCLDCARQAEARRPAARSRV